MEVSREGREKRRGLFYKIINRDRGKDKMKKTIFGVCGIEIYGRFGKVREKKR